jgi:signal transduction histidine kinase
VEIGPLPEIEADASLMGRIFQNLITNGMKYRRPEEKPVVKISGTISNHTCRLFIEDNGIGFEEKYLDRIFKPFQRLHGKTSPYEGTGMGLAICRKVAERHGGSITAKSAPGKGTIFIVTLPVRQG